MPEFYFHGKTWEDIKKLSLGEFSMLLPARERRAIKRGFRKDAKILLEEIKREPTKFHRTKNREIVIIPEMVGAKLGVYSGKEFVLVDIKPEMLGHRIGEFVLTRRQVKHSAPGFGATRSSKYIPLK